MLLFIAMLCLLALSLTTVLALALLILFRKRPKWRARLTKIVLFSFGILLSFGLAEIGVRALQILPDKYYIWSPFLRQDYFPDQAILPNVEGGVFRINNEGMRGDDYVPTQDHYRILTVGGSTTECIFNDQEIAWPGMLDQLLGITANGQQVWVGNVGKSGLHSAHHVLALEYLVPQYPELDMVIVMLGINDMLTFMRRGEAFMSNTLDPYANLEENLQATFQVEGNALGSKILALIATLDRANRRERALVIDQLGAYIAEGRTLRRNASYMIAEIPSTLDLALAQFAANVVRMAELAEAQNLRIVFLTQPHRYDPDNPPEVQSSIWAGIYRGEPPGGYYTIDVLQQAMNRFNEHLLATCEEHGFECFDIAGANNWTLPDFYDGVHYTDAGSLRFAEILAAYFRTTAPFE